MFEIDFVALVQELYEVNGFGPRISGGLPAAVAGLGNRW